MGGPKPRPADDEGAPRPIDDEGLPRPPPVHGKRPVDSLIRDAAALAYDDPPS